MQIEVNNPSLTTPCRVLVLQPSYMVEGRMDIVPNLTTELAPGATAQVLVSAEQSILLELQES